MAEVGWHDEDAPRMPRIDISAFGERPGSVTVPGPDPARDARVDAYRDRERRRAARLLDRYLEVAYEVSGHNLPLDGSLRLNAAGDRFVEAVGDYVLSRLQQKSHYGVPDQNPYADKSIDELSKIMQSDDYLRPEPRNADYGAVSDALCEHGLLIGFGRCDVAGCPASPVGTDE